MFRWKRNEAKTFKILRNQKKGVQVADPTQGEYIGFVFWVYEVVGGILV